MTVSVMTEITGGKRQQVVFLLTFFITITAPLLVSVQSAMSGPFTRCHKHKKGPKEDPWIIGSVAAAAELQVFNG